MLSKVHHIIIDLLFGLAGFMSGWFTYYFIRRRSPVHGISGAAFSHTMGNINAVIVGQNKQIAELSQKLTDAQVEIDKLMTQNNILERRVKALTDEVERLVEIIHRYNED